MEQMHTSTGQRPYDRHSLGTHIPPTGRAERELPRTAEREREQGTLEVFDPIGRLLLQQLFTGNTGVVEMDTRPLASGIYSVRAVADELLVGTSKFEVLR